jgi:hypothetical protein
MNARNFEVVETSVTELRKIMFNTLHIWIVAHHNLLVSNFADFSFEFLFFFFILGALLYTPCVLWLRPLCVINFFFFFMMRNPSKAGPLCVPTPVK